MSASYERDEPQLIGALLRVPFQATVARVHADLAAAGYTDLRPAHFVPFQHLQTGGSRITELGERAQMTKQSMGYLVDYLEERGYVERAPDPSDARAKLVRLTDRGRVIERLARASLERLIDEWATALGADRMRQLHETLEELGGLVERTSGAGERP